MENDYHKYTVQYFKQTGLICVFPVIQFGKQATDIDKIITKISYLMYMVP